MSESDWDKYRELAEKADAEGEHEDAESLWFAALQTVAFEGESDARLTMTLDGIAHSCFCQRKYAQAESLYWESLTLKEKHLDPQDVSIGRTLKALAAIYYEQGKYDQVEMLGKRALEIYEAALGPNHCDVAEIALNLAALYHKQKNTAKAHELYKRAINIRARNGEEERSRVVSPFNLRTGKPQATCDVCGRQYSGPDCLKCTQTRLQSLDDSK